MQGEYQRSILRILMDINKGITLMTRNLALSILILLLCYISTHISAWLNLSGWPVWCRTGLPYVIWSLSICVFWPFYRWRLLAITGLTGSFKRGVIWAVVFVLPMFVGFGLTSEIAELSLATILTKSVLPGFFEELMFRGFLVGMLISIARWYFFPAALANAFLFGIGHWFQGATPSEALMASAFTGVGGLWFAWLFIEWQRNLWLIASLHILMNACWVIWQVDDTVIGGQLANILRLSTIALSIILTVIINRSGRYKLGEI